MSEAGEERRGEARRRGLIRGSVVFGGGTSAYDCIVRDLTAQGARLKFSDPVLVPPIFELRLVERGQRIDAHKVWVRGNEMGVAFDAAPR